MYGSNLLHAVGFLVSGVCPKLSFLEINNFVLLVNFYLYLNNESLLHCLQPIDKQSLLDSGIMCCLVHILDALLGSDGGNVRQHVVTAEEDSEVTENVAPDKRFEVCHLLLFYI